MDKFDKSKRFSTEHKPQRNKSTSFGGSKPTSYGGSKPTSYGGSKPTSYGGSKPTSYGGSKPTSYGGSKPTSYGGSKPTSYGRSKPTYGGSKPTSFEPQRNNQSNSDNQQEPREDIIAGRNPVIEVLKSDTPIDSIYLQKTENKSGAILKIMSLAREKGLVIKEVAKEKLDTLSVNANHQGVVAVAAAYKFSSIEEIIARAKDEPLFVIIADEIEDPHNLGAIIRTADAAGAHGVIIPKRRGVGLTSAVMRASAGAASHVAVAKVSNLVDTIKQLKEMGVWVYAADMGGKAWTDVDYSGAVGLVIGSEGHGVSRLIKENCDVVVSLPMKGTINSLNASVAAAIVMYEVSRQRTAGKGVVKCKTTIM